MGLFVRCLLIGLIGLACHDGGYARHEVARARPAETSSRAGRPDGADQHASLTLIEGHYEIVGAAPDGDSVKFYPRDKKGWNTLGRSARVRTNRRGGAQLRLEGIDALETHYAPGRGRVGVTHQPLDLARAAASGLLDWLGFTSVARNARDTVVAAKPRRLPGYILTRAADRYGRCIAFAFRGDHPGTSGDRVRVDAAMVQQSLNYAMLERGWVYPTYYATLRRPFREALARAVHSAQKARLGVWANDRSTSGFRVGSLQDVQREGYIFPKLYRRLMDYFEQQAGDTRLARFSQYLAAHDDRVLVVSTGERTGFQQIVETRGQVVRLLKPVDDLLFLE